MKKESTHWIVLALSLSLLFYNSWKLDDNLNSYLQDFVLAARHCQMQP